MKKSLKVINLFLESELDKSSELTGLSKQSVKTLLYKKFDRILKGIYSDDSWIPINDIFKQLKDMSVDYEVDKTSYNNELPPTSKTWYFTINYVDNKNKNQKLVCQLKAHGAGSVSDPLDRYDLTLVMN